MVALGHGPMLGPWNPPGGGHCFFSSTRLRCLLKHSNASLLVSNWSPLRKFECFEFVIRLVVVAWELAHGIRGMRSVCVM